MDEEPYAGLRSPRTRATDPVMLKCGHLVIYDPYPRPGDTLYCYRCRDYSLAAIKTVVKRVPDVRIIQCRDCYYRRRLTEHFEWAKSIAQTHALKKGHVVDVSNATKIIGTVTGSLSYRALKET